MNSFFRNTGRTKRLFESAILKANNHSGSNVYVIFESLDFHKDFIKKYRGYPTNIEILSTEQAIKKEIINSQLEVNKDIQGIVYIDHYVIEMRLGEQLRMLHKFDKYLRLNN